MSCFTVYLNDISCDAEDGDTILQVARRADIWIPTLCHDPRLEPTAACRMCLVEVNGEKRLQPACVYKVTPGIEVLTESQRIERHRSALLGIYLADHPLDTNGLPVETARNNELSHLAKLYLPITLDPVKSPRKGRPEDSNPYIEFSPELCILCARCTRYCDEVAGVNAIALSQRGARTTIATASDKELIHTSCELCGGCIDTCPTGALTEKKPSSTEIQGAIKKVRTTCNYCGVGCQIDLNVADNQVVKVTAPNPGETVNDGNLCVKGRFAYDFIGHPDRLKQPLIRDPDGKLYPTDWNRAIERAVGGLMEIKDRHGADALGFISSSRCTGEENYLLQKMARAAFGTNNCHQCAAT
ncbi:MAG: molybdopterin-dependent oxidoreductase [Proteobacteria bacterium]|nr:molybdopterin-dependent oxidoreductase [Pseudomonadota bacterium]